ncbi:hypothetical protein AAFM71_03835 [Chromobacterium violaceum]|uniref:hypothetical protein n=1 Tax=Chromobacterium violaceum TaxID=536 RepID=UPI00385F9DD3
MNDIVKEAVSAPGMLDSESELWGSVILRQMKGDSDVQAMITVRKKMPARTSNQLFSDVFAAVYIDTYWTSQGASADILATSLAAAMGISQVDALQYARVSFRQWRGILCRKYPGDGGAIPSPNYFNALDIVTSQVLVLTPRELIDHWDSTVNPPKAGVNYAYARCQNLGFEGEISGVKVRMFAVPAGFTQTASSWVQCRTRDGDQEEGNILDRNGHPAKLTTGERGASEAFVADLPLGHVCLVATITDADFFTKNNPLTIEQGNWNFVTWLINNGAAAWRNVNTVPKLGETSLVFHNQDGTPEQFSFVMRCRGVPEGSKLRMYSDDPDAAFDSGMVTVVKDSQELRVSVIAPPHYAGQLKLHLEGPNGRGLPSSASVEIGMLWCVPHSNSHYLQAVDLLGEVGAVPTLRSVHVPMGYFTFLGENE